MVWIWQHKFHAAKGVPRPGILTQLIGEVTGTDRRPVDRPGIDTAYSSLSMPESFKILEGNRQPLIRTGLLLLPNSI
jgi:hypothetical protein